MSNDHSPLGPLQKSATGNDFRRNVNRQEGTGAEKEGGGGT